MRMATKLNKHDTAIVDSGASGWNFTPESLVPNANKTAATIRVGTATGQAQESEASCKLPLPDLPSGLFGHVMSGLKHNMLGIGNLCDKYCKDLFTKQSFIIYDRNNKPFLKGWRETSGAKMWCISLRPDLANCPPCHEYPTADAQ